MIVDPLSSSRRAERSRAALVTRVISEARARRRQLVRIAYHRYLESLVGLSGNAHVYRTVSNHGLACGIVMSVALWVALKRAHQCRHDERQITQGYATFGRTRVQMLAHRVERRDVHFLDVGKMRDAARRLAHALGNHAPDADDRNFLHRGTCLTGRRRGRHLGWSGSAAGGQRVLQISGHDAATRAGTGDAWQDSRLPPVRAGEWPERPAPLRPPERLGASVAGRAARLPVVFAGASALAPAGAAGFAEPVSAVSKVASSAPTAMMSPGLPVMLRTRPLTGEGISTTALSVDISTRGWSSLSRSPALTCQAMISADTVPSPRSGSLKT